LNALQIMDEALRRKAFRPAAERTGHTAEIV
jgi:hypothetical protein